MNKKDVLGIIEDVASDTYLSAPLGIAIVLLTSAKWSATFMPAFSQAVFALSTIARKLRLQQWALEQNSHTGN